MGAITDHFNATVVAVALGALAVGGGCERESRGAPDAGRSMQEAKLEVRPFESPEPVDLVEPPPERRRELEFGEPRRYPACREILESGGEIRERLMPERERTEWVLYGCDPEAYRKLEDGRRYVAYGEPPGRAGSRDLQLVAYDSEGKRNWAYRMDRSRTGEQFTASFRSSFIAPLLPHLVCVGTLWADETQLSCLEADSGTAEWEGTLDFRSGIPFRGYDTALHGADRSGLTRRYPYSGVEMERTDFRGEGGPGALYATDGEQLFFAPSEGEPSRLTAYSFETMEPTWRAELPEPPDAGYAEGAFADHETVAVKLRERFYGLDTSSGAVRWAFEVGDDRPSVASGPDRLYLLLQRAQRANLLYAVEPASGNIEWYGPVPTGTLEVAWVGSELLIRSVRAFQPVRISR